VQIAPNFFVVGLDGSGRFAIHPTGGVHFLVDVSGYYAPWRAGRGDTVRNRSPARKELELDVKLSTAPEWRGQGPIR
jgi:hypothetical protein